MTQDEVIMLLGLAKGMDPLIAIDELSVGAWMNVLPKEITLNDAMRYVREHYQDTDKILKPAHVVGRHRMNTTPVRDVVISRDHDCMNGYIIITQVTEKGHAYEAASPCPQCTKPQHQSARISGRET
jgi:hypothetical protein